MKYDDGKKLKDMTNDELIGEVIEKGSQIINLEFQLQQAQQKLWISIKEQLPKHNQIVAIVEIETMVIYAALFDKNLGFFVYHPRGVERLIASHWMPLPDVPINKLRR